MFLGSLTYKKITLILHMVFICSIWCYCQPIAGKLDNKCDNYLYIKGTSNVNEFTFSYNAANIPSKNDSKKSSESVEINIPIRHFKASNPVMYNDFLVLMKETEHPQIKVSFSKDELTKALRDYSAPCPDISITIAGVTRVYKVSCSIVNCGNNYYLSGEQAIKLSDFELKPPEKLMGLVKVNNKIEVDFGFIITFTNNNQLSSTL
jgi:hypothetical protein